MPSTLETERLVLEPWHERHAEPFIRLTADTRVMRHIGRGTPWSGAEARQRFGQALDHWEEHGFGWRAVIEKATGAWAGLVALNRLGPGIEGVDQDETEIGWWLRAASWHRGLGTEGAAAARDDAFAQLGPARIIARCRTGNTPSLRIMHKLGMTPLTRTTGRHHETLAVHAIDLGTWRGRPDR
jgi:RimJ/RimL family protein N-acetyltransferase